MAELTVEMTYGEALYEAAVEAGLADEVLEEGFAVLEIIKKQPELSAFMAAPTIAAYKKKNVLKNIFNDKISELLLNLIFILVDRRRTRVFPKIMRYYKVLHEREDGYVYGQIVSATPLTDDRICKFEEETGRLISEKVKLENEVDPYLIGGVKIMVSGKLIDTSLRSGLENLGSTLITKKGGAQ